MSKIESHIKKKIGKEYLGDCLYQSLKQYKKLLEEGKKPFLALGISMDLRTHCWTETNNGEKNYKIYDYSNKEGAIFYTTDKYNNIKITRIKEIDSPYFAKCYVKDFVDIVRITGEQYNKYLNILHRYEKEGEILTVLECYLLAKQLV